MKPTKIIKVNLGQPKPQPVQPEKPKVPDLILNFSDGTKVYTLWVPCGEMGKVAQMFCDLMDQHKIVFKLEERL